MFIQVRKVAFTLFSPFLGQSFSVFWHYKDYFKSIKLFLFKLCSNFPIFYDQKWLYYKIRLSKIWEWKNQVTNKKIYIWHSAFLNFDLDSYRHYALILPLMTKVEHLEYKCHRIWSIERGNKWANARKRVKRVAGETTSRSWQRVWRGR